MLILRSIGLLDIEIPRKEIISTDGRTDGQTSRTTTIGSFFEKNPGIIVKFDSKIKITSYPLTPSWNKLHILIRKKLQVA